MKTYFYEVTYPYSAVIKAHDEDEVLKVYEEIVSDVEEDEKERFFDDLEIISEENIREQLTKCFNEETNEIMTKKEQEDVFNQEAPSLILMERM